MVGVEDWFILASLLLSTGFSAAVYEQAVWGLGRHIDSVTPDQLSGVLHASWVALIFYNLSLSCTKISTLLLYVRVLTYENFRRAALGMLLFVSVVSMGVLAAIITACVPLHKYWDGTKQGYCHPPSVWWGVTGFNVGSDFMIVLLPLPVVFSLTLPRREKFGLIAVFVTGFFVCFISILRIVWLRQLSSSKDFTSDLAIIAIWSCIEVNTAIICACVTTLRPMYRKLIPARLSRPLLDEEAYVGDRPKTVGSLRSRPIPLHNDHDITLVSEWSRPGTATTRSTDMLNSPEALNMHTISIRSASPSLDACALATPTLPPPVLICETAGIGRNALPLPNVSPISASKLW